MIHRCIASGNHFVNMETTDSNIPENESTCLIPKNSAESIFKSNELSLCLEHRETDTFLGNISNNILERSIITDNKIEIDSTNKISKENNDGVVNSNVIIGSENNSEIHVSCPSEEAISFINIIKTSRDLKDDYDEDNVGPTSKNKSTILNIDNANSENLDDNITFNKVLTSSSVLLEKSSASGKTTSPSGSCLRSGSKGGGSSSSGPHVQFETPTASQDNIFGNGYYIGDSPLKDGREVTGYWIKTHPERGIDYEGGFITGSKKKKRNRHVSGSSTNSIGSTNSVDSEAPELQRKAPDGGWGWVVVVASFFVHCIADGVTMSFGVLFIELLNQFKESKSFTSLVGSLFMAIPLLAGPIASVLTDHFGCRTVTIAGAIVAFIGFFLSAFANSIVFLLITLGVITGLGLAVCYVAAIVIVAFYFEKRRSLATGIAVAGSGIGTFVFAPFLQHLIDGYGWRGCLIIVSGLFLNMCVCGAVMRDLEWTKKRNDKSSQSTLPPSRPDSSSHSVESLSFTPHVSRPHTPCPTVPELKQILQSGDVTALLSPDEPLNKYSRSFSMWTLPTFINRNHNLPPDIFPCLDSKGNTFEIISQMYPHLISTSFGEQIDLLPMLSDTRLHRMMVENASKINEDNFTPTIEGKDPENIINSLANKEPPLTIISTSGEVNQSIQVKKAPNFTVKLPESNCRLADETPRSSNQVIVNITEPEVPGKVNNLRQIRQFIL